MEYILIKSESEGYIDCVAFNTGPALLAYMQHQVDDDVDISSWNVFTIGEYVPVKVEQRVTFGE